MVNADPLTGGRDLARGEQLLEGLRVLGPGLLVAGPFATRIMAEFGAEVLALPDTDDSSFNWAAYLVPLAAFLVAAVAIAIALRRWRSRNAAATDAGPPPAPLSPSESARLEQDLTRYDL